MDTNCPRVLARVDPMTVIIEPNSVIPSDWDTKAVAEDLREYVQLSRLIKATPVVHLVKGLLKVVSGEPFLRAAQEIDPPLEEVVCMVEADEEMVRAFGLKTINPTELLDKYPENETYDALEILTFTRALTDLERKSIEDRIAAFFTDINAHPSQHRENYSAMSPFEWYQLHNRVRWTWKRNDQFGPNVVHFLEVLRNMNQNVARL